MNGAVVDLVAGVDSVAEDNAHAALPDSSTNAGITINPLIMDMLNRTVRQIYRNCDLKLPMTRKSV